MKNLSITLKVIIYVSILGFSCIFAMGYVSISAADDILTKNAHDHLTSVQAMKKQLLESYVEQKITTIDALAKMPMTIKSTMDMVDLGESSANANNIDTEDYRKSLQSYMSTTGMNNIIIADTRNGKIVYSENNQGLNIELSQESNTLSKLWRYCLRSTEPVISDMYQNPNGDPTVFIGSSIISEGQIIAVIIAELSSQGINNIMMSNEGMGETGETYLVGSDLLFRSNSKFNSETTILSGKVKTVATERVFNGQSGSDLITDYRGNTVLSSYDKLDIAGLDWAIITEIDESEIMAPKKSLINTILIICAIIGAIMMPVLYIIGQSLSKPLKLEVEYASRLANGELDATIDINQKDEIGVLADALRTIAASTKKVITGCN